MKIKEVLIMCMVLVLLALCFCGCKAKNADFRVELVKSPPNWVALYGDNFESQQTANIVLAIQVINRQGEAIKVLDKRLIELEDPNNFRDRVLDIDVTALMSDSKELK